MNVFGRICYRVRGFLGVRWRLHWRLFVLLGAFFAAGIVLGSLTAMNPKIKADSISAHLIDSNLTRVIRPTATFGGIVIARIWFFALTFALIFVCSLRRLAVPVVFAVVAYRGFALAVNLYWVIAKFGFATGFLLFLVYTIILVALSFLVIAAAAWSLLNPFRPAAGGLGGIIPPIKSLYQDLIRFGIAIGILALFEYLLFILLIARIVFVV